MARDRAFTSAQLAGAAIEPVLAVSTERTTLDRAIASTPAGAAGRLAMYLTGTSPDANGMLVGGPRRATTRDPRTAAAAARSFITPVPGGYAVLQPVALGDGRMAVTEVFVPAAEVSRGVAASWAVMTAIAVVLIGVSVTVPLSRSRVAESTGGGLKIGTSALGGAQVQLRLRTWAPLASRATGRRRRTAGLIRR